MIVKNVDAGWEIIFQPAHALLAGTIAAHFQEAYRGPFWFETLTAITIHDDQKIEFRAGSSNSLTRAGAPQDFTMKSMSAEERFVEVRDRLRNAYQKHRWIGILESLHADFLYSEEEVSKPLRQLLDEEKGHRRSLLRQLKIGQKEAQAVYQLMRWCDRCSLILCQGALPAMERKLEITTLGKARFDIWQCKDKNVCIEPWPFDQTEFAVSIEVFKLSQPTFADDMQLSEALMQCKPIQRTWNFQSSAS
ncbi:DUF3891 family protein [Blastopirellula marina]|uniref:DUF3891 family protein n=1 Tax=Blastopirellula marina DSM 3645 TaxID=314230 RepID=A3ZS83_9BACT|nr:DUF3891 family protein [Blastopirellula marina]EAQ80541.1 hypothetical protein DSM3645_14385 [Blastopirellula marina DSM 3645]